MGLAFAAVKHLLQTRERLRVFLLKKVGRVRKGGDELRQDAFSEFHAPRVLQRFGAAFRERVQVVH